MRRGFAPVRALALIFAGCSMLLVSCGTMVPANEQFHQEQAKTVYRSADEETREAPPSIVPHQKIPGE
jgi:hypothetical protein